ncbi:MAG: metalloregulator ArsR/SmtB family transcription factor [Patescibacteria group bacterium]
MGKKQLGIKSSKTKTTKSKGAFVYARPAWVKSGEEELCPDCFKVVGDKSRYNLVCLLGKTKEGMTVGELTDQMQLRQPTISHHLNILRSVDAVESEDRGRERVYTLNRSAHCFEDCQIPFK